MMDPSTARALWKALMDNASGLIADAYALLERESFSRARSLTILAQEELGKALWIYEVFEQDWNTGANEVREVSRLTSDGRRHAIKYTEAFIFGQELAAFWGDYESANFPEAHSPKCLKAHFAKNKDEAQAAGKRANNEKLAGFYADLDGNEVRSPADVSKGTIDADLQTAAQVVEMLLIKDHSRMKLEASTPYDSTQEQQHRLLRISHPEDWDVASREFCDGDYLEGLKG